MVEQGAGQKVLQLQGEPEEFPEEGAVGGGKESKGDRGGGLGEEAMVHGLGKTQKEGQRRDRTEEHQGVVEQGKEVVQARESEKHPGEPVKNPPGGTE